MRPKKVVDENNQKKTFSMIVDERFLDELEKLRSHYGFGNKSNVLRFLIRQKHVELYGVEE